ncbi:MAG TPA: flippase-like domain-containing protein [Campylobacterales bacterium]|nr:flippase-like domain-containing protein [Campylobacterales bacterium]
MLVTINKKILKIAIKIILTFIAIYFVFSKVELKEVQKIVIHANIWYLLLAFLFFNLSKILSSIRLNIYFAHIGVKISQLYALKLYYIGMFYNLFLPGGVGGDGYKIYLLKKSHNTKVSTLITATLLDRLSGLIPLLFFTGLLFIGSDFYHKYIWLDWVAIVGVITIFPIFYLINIYFFKGYIEIFFKTTLLGSLVQLLQLVSAFFIVYAIGYNSNMIIFLTLFLISSVVAVLPISIGGVGVRELTFLYGLTLLEIDADGGVAFSILFFLITAFSSFIGAIL